MAFYPEGANRVSLAQANASNSINTPGTGSIAVSPGLEGSMQQVMAENLGRYVQIDFLIGVQTLVRHSGVLFSVGRSFVVLFNETQRTFVLCDVFAAKFITFYEVRPQPGQMGTERVTSQGILGVDAGGNLQPVEQIQGYPTILDGNAMSGANVPGRIPMTDEDAQTYFSQGQIQASRRTMGEDWR